MRLLRIEHLIAAAVAAGCIGLALAQGGFAPTAFAATGVVVWLAIVLGIATGVLPRAELPVPALATGLCLTGLAVLVALSMTWAADDGHAFEDAVRALSYVGVLALVVVSSRRGDAGAWLRGLAFGLVGVGAIALLARFQPGLFGNPDADLAATLPATLGRLSYPIGYWNGLAASMAAAAVLLAFFGASGSTRLGRAAATGALAVPVLALWMTDSRGGLIAAGLALAVLLAATAERARLIATLALGAFAGVILIGLANGREELLNDPLASAAGPQGDAMLVFLLIAVAAAGALRYAADGAIQRAAIPRWAGRAAIAAAALLVVVALLVVDPIESFDEFKQVPSAEELADGEVGFLRGGGSGRYQFWEAAIDAFAEAPVRGVGASGYGPYWLEHREIALQATRAHSVAFEMLAELGLGGLALMVGFFAVPAVTGVRRRRRPRAAPELAPALALLAVAAAAAAVDWTWDLPAVFVPTLVAAGLLVGPATLSPRAPAGSSVIRGITRSRRRFGRGVAVLLVAWISICAAGLLLYADNRLEASRDAAAAGDGARAIGLVNEAIDLQPWAAEPRVQLALLRELEGDLPAARGALDEAIARARDDFELQLLAYRLDRSARDDAAAAEHLARALELNPMDPRLSPITELGLEPTDPAVLELIESEG